MDQEEKLRLFKHYYKYFRELGQRDGQATFNAVSILDNKLGEEIRATEDDCYYDDKKSKNLIKKYLDKN